MRFTRGIVIMLATLMSVYPVNNIQTQEIVNQQEEAGIAVAAMSESSRMVAEVMTYNAAVVSGDTGIAGATLLLNNFFNNMTEEADNAIYVDGVKMKAVQRVPSPYENLGIANVQDYVNIRSGPSTDYAVVGKLYKGCVANVLGYEGDWVKIQSGNLEEGYIRSDYLLIGWDAEEKIEQYCDKVATVTCDVLNVRTGMSTSDSIYDQIPYGESYYIAEEYDEWVKIMLGADDSTGNEHTGYVFKEYVDISYEFQYAVTIEEEQARIAAEQAAKKAEQERLRKLAEEEAAKKAAAEAKKKAEEAAKKEQQKTEANQAKEELQQQASLSTDAAKLRQEIAAYATKFVGNPYVYGGTSLTNGADCSGFVQSIYKQFGYSLPRVSKDQAKSAGVKDVTPTPDYLLPGDLIFYRNSSGVVDHVALYIGNGKVVHAANKKSGIIISKYNMRTPYKARRVIE